MPINLRYGQQAVARGFITSPRLEQILAKQRHLKEQGKTVSIRMILEKAKLLDPAQLQQIDRDLNIKVVKKNTAKLQRPGIPAAPATSARDFAGEAPPQFDGMDGGDADATLFSPPPPDMQQRVAAEREAAKSQQHAAQDSEVQGFLNQDSASPFGNDPFAGDAFAGEMEPMEMEPMGMEPMEMGADPFAQSDASPMQAEPEMAPMTDDPFGSEMQPMGMDADPFGAAEPIDATAQYPILGDEPEALERLGSSPKLASLAVEFDGFNTGEDEELPMVEAGFDQQAYTTPMPVPISDLGGPELAPAADGFDAMDEDLPGAINADLMSPEQLESSPAKEPAPQADMNATMFSPPPPGTPGISSPREKTGAMENTMFSPPPPGFKDAVLAAAEPEGDNWGEDHPVEPAFDNAAGAEETVFSPPPASAPAPQSSGRHGTDDFGDIDIPSAGAPIGDVPTAPAAGDPVHPIRQGVQTSSARQDKQRPPSSAQVQIPTDEEVLDELPSEEPVMRKPKLPGGKGLPSDKGLPSKKTGSSSKTLETVPSAEVDGDEPKKKGKGKLLLMLLLLIVIAALVLPILMPGKVPAVDNFRNGAGKPVYDYIQSIYDSINGKKKSQPEEDNVIIPAGNEPAGNQSGNEE